MAMKFKNLTVTPIAGENRYLVKRNNSQDSWEITVTYIYITGYEVDVDIVGDVEIKLINPKFGRDGKLKNRPPLGTLKQLFMAISRYDMCVDAKNPN